MPVGDGGADGIILGLREVGVPQERPARLRSSVGLDLGARTPEEAAISITAEIVAHTDQGTGLPLSGLAGPIHMGTSS
jgi:xanthine dehydrogenase accessory factor